MRQKHLRLIVLAIVLILAFGTVQGQGGVPLLTVEVIRDVPHDTGAWVQGLVYHDGLLYESTGAKAGSASSLRQIDPETGDILQMVNVTTDFYGEGLALAEDRLIQITWTDEIANVYDLETLEQIDTYTYEGEGWGLCYDGRYLYHSNGSQYIAVREPDTFALIANILVTYQGTPVGQLTAGGQPLHRLNELECVDNHIYSNVWQTDFILQIDKYTGEVTAAINAIDLLTTDERSELTSGQVLNGIAYNPETETFWLTGKEWPKLFEVRFVMPEE